MRRGSETYHKMNNLPSLATYVSHTEYYGQPSSIAEFRTFLRKFKRDELVYTCSVINALLETWQSQINVNAHEQLIKDAFFPKDASRLMQICRAADHPRFVFHRLQLLFVMKEAIIECGKEGINPFETQYWGGLGLAFLMANDLLHIEYTQPHFSEKRDLERIIQHIPMLEYTGQSSFSQKAARTYLMLTKFCPQPDDPNHVDIDEVLNNSKGFKSKTYSAVCIGILSHFLEADYEKLLNRESTLLFNLDFFSNTLIPQDSLKLILNELSTDGETFSASFEARNLGLLDMTPLRDRPIYKLENNTYFALDTRFLSEKLESGLFWLTHNCLQTNHEKEKFHRFWGYAFENYVNWLIKTANSSERNEFFPSPIFSKGNAQVCDGIIRSGNNLVFMEYKGRTFTAKAKYGQDQIELSQELEKHLIGNNIHHKGVSQLARSINKSFDKNNPEAIEGINTANINKIFPVLITRDSLGSCFYLNTYINKRANGLVKKKKLKPRIVTPFFCLSIEEFETLVAYLPLLKLSELLHGWYRIDNLLRFSFLSLEDKISAITSIGFKRNNYLNQFFDDVWDEANEALFSS